MPDKKNLTPKQQLKAIGGVAALSFKLAPLAVSFKLVGSVINALLPLATTYYAALTTSALAAAYGGDQAAKRDVIVYVIITALLGLVMTAWSSLDNFIQSKMRYIVETRISNRMYDHFLSLEFWRYDDKGTIDTYDKALNFSRFYAWIFDRLATIVSQLIGVASAVIALSVINWKLSIFILLAITPGIYVQFRLSRAQVKHWNANVEGRRMLTMLEWLISLPRYITELRLHGIVKHLLGKRIDLRDADELERMHIERRSLPLTLLSNVLTAGAELAALIWIALQIAAGKQPVGQFIYVQQIVSRAIASAGSLVSTLSSMDEDIANLFDYERFMRLPVQSDNGKNLTAGPQTITLDHVSFKYFGEDSPLVLSDVSFAVNQGQHIAIVGENGAGKSTLIKLLLGLYTPSSGTIRIDDTDLRDIKTTAWHAQLSVLSQEFIAYDFDTVRKNVEYGNVDAPASEARVREALTSAEALDFVEKLPKGLDSFVNNWMEDNDGIKGSDLSGGQWQRLALARSLYRDTPIVVLDEPTSAIDALAENRIFEHLFKRPDRTVIAISHRLSTIKKADTIYMLQNGKIVESGSYTELLARKGHFYTMFESQIV